MKRLLWADVAARRRMIAGLVVGTAVFVLALASIEAIGGLSEVGRQAFGEAPPALSALAGSRSGFDVFTPLGLLAFAFNHPFFLALSLAIGVAIGTAAIAGDVESGRAQLWYTRPVPRHLILRGRLVFWLLAQICVVAAGVAGGVLASLLSDSLGTDGAGVAIRAGVQFLPLALFIGALSFAVSAFAPTRARALGRTLGITFLAYLANFVSLLWSTAEPLRWITPFGYYDPLGVVQGIRWWDAVALSTAAAALILIAHAGLARRDLA
ncbi:MAG TPA: ABC transporter permease subunit [Jiangellaceae bacterium]